MSISIKDTFFFEDCMNRIDLMCKHAFNEKTSNMTLEEREKAEIRLFEELSIINANEFYYEFFIYKTIMEFSITEKHFIVISGQAEYSYVSYLLGITSVDPLERGYPIEMLLGYHHDRSPWMFVFSPVGFKKELTEYFVEIFGEDNITNKENYIIIGNKEDIEKHVSSNSIWIPVFTRQLITKVQEIILSDAPFKKVRNLVLAPTYPSGVYEAGIVNLDILKQFADEENPIDAEEDYCSVLDGTYESLLKALAIINGAGLLKANLRDGNGNLICTRDDFYRYGIKLLGSEKKAFDFMTRIRKGQAKNECFWMSFIDIGVPENIMEKLKNIRYVVSEGSLIPIAQIILYLSSRNENA